MRLWNFSSLAYSGWIVAPCPACTGGLLQYVSFVMPGGRVSMYAIRLKAVSVLTVISLSSFNMSCRVVRTVLPVEDIMS